MLARYGASPAQLAALVFVALFLIAFLIVPLLRVILVAFTDPAGGFSLVHFGDFFRTSLLMESFWNSIVVAALTVVLASLIAVPLATILARFRFRGAALIHTLGVIPLVMPPFVGAVAMQLIYGKNGAINLLLLDTFGFRIPFMDGLNGVIFVEALHYFPFILLNLSASLANIDSAMEESAQNLGAHGFTLFRKIVFPLALPGYVAGAALVFVKVFDDLATPLLLNVNNMLAPQAYLKITSVGIADPQGYVISVIMIGCSLGAMLLSALTLRGRDYATTQRGGGGLSRRRLGRSGTALAIAFALGEEVDEPRPVAAVGGACVAFLVPTEGELAAVSGLEEAEALDGVRWVRTYRATGWRFGSFRRGADRAGAVLAVGADRDEALARARRAADTVRFEVDAATA